MTTLRKPLVALYVDRSSQQWIVRDPEGNFWLVPSVENPWDHREPFQPDARRRTSSRFRDITSTCSACRSERRQVYRDRRTRPTRRGPRAERPLEEVGAVPQRAAVGNRARGLQRGRRRLELLHPRPGPLARLSLGRGRPGRHLRRPAAALLRAGPVERQGPDPQGAPLRPDQQREQSRRGRQGVLLLPRQHADPLVHEVPLQVPAGGLPLRRPRRDQPAPEPERVRVRAARHRRLRRGSLLRRVRRVRQGHRPRTSSSRSASTTAAPRRPSCTSCRRSGSATSGPGTATADRPVAAGRSPRPRRARRPGRRRQARRALPLLRGGRPAAVHGERDEHAADLRRPEPDPVRQGQHQRLRRPRPGRTR